MSELFDTVNEIKKQMDSAVFGSTIELALTKAQISDFLAILGNLFYVNITENNPSLYEQFAVAVPQEVRETNNANKAEDLFTITFTKQLSNKSIATTTEASTTP
ncbi:MAG: hypothetical protein ABFQ62_00870 [Patescibacteria group bacterium]